MPHLARIGRKSWSARLLVGLMYLLLTLGGATMVIPFLLWLSLSSKSEVDSQDFDVVPAYWHSQPVLTRKYLEQQANYDIECYGLLARDGAPTFKSVALPAPATARAVEEYRAFVHTLPPEYTLLCAAGLATQPLKYGLQPSVEAYRAWCVRRYGSLAEMNQAYQMNIATLSRLIPPREAWWQRTYQPLYDRVFTDYLDFKYAQPVAQRVPVPAEGVWPQYLKARLSGDVTAVNAALRTTYRTLESAPCLPRRPVGAPALARAWEACMRQDMALWYLRVDAAARPAWTTFLTRRYHALIPRYNAAHGTQYRDFAAVPLPDGCPRDAAGMGEWNDFITTAAPVASLSLDTPEMRYRAFLRARYQTLPAVNAAYGTTYTDWEAIIPPTPRVWAADSIAQAGALRWDFATRNYRTVAQYMFVQGRAFMNTMLYVGLALLFSLTINPLAAYALSRFKLPATNKVLLFLLATMAFPAEIAMIPNFLLLKELSLLNTFWALVLPGMANGFSIFLLKGMFDGLPQDLYEAAELDGAGEATIFWRLSLPLVQPFLAYLALGTFIGAYSAFAFAFILCPDEKMWTLMVYLQQMEQWASLPIQFAGFVLASIPTLIVFVTCQRVIMRGIVLPTEK